MAAVLESPSQKSESPKKEARRTAYLTPVGWSGVWSFINKERKICSTYLKICIKNMQLKPKPRNMQKYAVKTPKYAKICSQKKFVLYKILSRIQIQGISL
jgi:hypothetical protein